MQVAVRVGLSSISIFNMVFMFTMLTHACMALLEEQLESALSRVVSFYRNCITLVAMLV